MGCSESLIVAFLQSYVIVPRVVVAELFYKVHVALPPILSPLVRVCSLGVDQMVEVA